VQVLELLYGNDINISDWPRPFDIPTLTSCIHKAVEKHKKLDVNIRHLPMTWITRELVSEMYPDTHDKEFGDNMKLLDVYTKIYRIMQKMPPEAYLGIYDNI